MENPEQDWSQGTYEEVFVKFKRYYDLSDEDVAGLEEDEAVVKLLREFFKPEAKWPDPQSVLCNFDSLSRFLEYVDPKYLAITWKGWSNFLAKILAKHEPRRRAEREARLLASQSAESVECSPEEMTGAMADIGTSNRPSPP